MNKTDKERLKKVVQIWTKLTAQIKEQNITEEAILNNEFVQWAINTPLYNIGEQVYQMTNEFKKAHPELPWSRVSGLRHRLVHDYDETNWNIIAEIVFEDIPEFIQSVEQLLSEM